LNSQNREAHKQKIAQQNKPTSWADAVQPKGHVSNNFVEQKVVFEHRPFEQKVIFEQKNVSENGKSDFETKNNLPEKANCDKENFCVDEIKVECDVVDDNGRNLTENYRILSESDPVWILPPSDDESKKKKKKNKNKKKVVKI
jgi:hypothetical protein